MEFFENIWSSYKMNNESKKIPVEELKKYHEEFINNVKSSFMGACYHLKTKARNGYKDGVGFYVNSIVKIIRCDVKIANQQVEAYIYLEETRNDVEKLMYTLKDESINGKIINSSNYTFATKTYGDQLTLELVDNVTTSDIPKVYKLHGRIL